ncbi:ATP-dependent 6-phosphofructokinase [Quillaja saponaria]|uniref:ATP-dependent 6-phosphofructokinase n=1 Tax=Quillaja saponaria TaxID=32244 RepID=A0AAD7KVA2_QUISA|nr:ATP-dependent 6-phosphofructokinase [Quillaja saponaria]
MTCRRGVVLTVRPPEVVLAKRVLQSSGDGTMHGAVKILDGIRRRKVNVAVVGIPKTADNDMCIIDRSFGFQTAVEMAQQAISAAMWRLRVQLMVLVWCKLMGRSTGHIAFQSSCNTEQLSCCLLLNS